LLIFYYENRLLLISEAQLSNYNVCYVRALITNYSSDNIKDVNIVFTKLLKVLLLTFHFLEIFRQLLSFVCFNSWWFKHLPFFFRSSDWTEITVFFCWK